MPMYLTTRRPRKILEQSITQRHMDEYCKLDSLFPARQGGRVRMSGDEIKKLALTIFDSQHPDKDKHVLSVNNLSTKDFLGSVLSEKPVQKLVNTDVMRRVP